MRLLLRVRTTSRDDLLTIGLLSFPSYKEHITIGFQPINRHYHERHVHALDFALLLSDRLQLGHFTIICYVLWAVVDYIAIN